MAPPGRCWGRWWGPLLPSHEPVAGGAWLRVRRSKRGGGEEDNKELLDFVNSWLDSWLGYVEETVFDVNCMMLNEHTVLVSSYNKQVFDFFKKHKIVPIICPLRHRFFFDGGIHCVTQDLYREGECQSYIDYK